MDKDLLIRNSYAESDEVFRPAIRVQASKIIDYAELLALGSGWMEEAAHKSMINHQVLIVRNQHKLLNKLSKEYSTKESQIRKSLESKENLLSMQQEGLTVQEMYSRIIDQSIEEIEATEIHRIYWDADKKLSAECEKLVEVEHMGYAVYALQNSDREGLYARLIEKEAARIANLPELYDKPSLKKNVGRDKVFALYGANQLIRLLRVLIEVAARDKYKKGLYSSDEIPIGEKDVEQGRLVFTPSNYSLKLEIPDIEAGEKLLAVIERAEALSTRSKIRIFRKALEEERALKSLLLSCNEKYGFGRGELDTVLQNISRFNAKVNSKNAMRN